MKEIEICSREEFQRIKKSYHELNDSFTKKIIFHVGTGAGLYSELGSMLECMCYCYVNKMKFTMYADDANFSGENGWGEFFEEFCRLSHDPLNRVGNYRYRNHFRWRGVPLPNLFFRRVFFPFLLKKRTGAAVLTQDIFKDFTGAAFKEQIIQWSELSIDGCVKAEYAKLRKLALRYNRKTLQEINERIAALKLPESYTSIQIRGGDKIKEYKELIPTEYCLDKIDEWKIEIENLFVFTDDYRNVEIIRRMRPQWKVFTLCRNDERGYYNDAFNKADWSYKRDNLIKLFAMVEICIHSDLHLGCAEACVNNFIRSAKEPEKYMEFEKGQRRTRF